MYESQNSLESWGTIEILSKRDNFLLYICAQKLVTFAYV